MGLSKAETEEITKHYYDDIYKFCVSRCGNKEDGADTAQSVFLLFMHRAGELENKSIRARLISVADLKVRECFREKKKDCGFLCYEECEDIADDRVEDSGIIEDFEKLLTETQKKILSVLTERAGCTEKQRFSL